MFSALLTALVASSSVYGASIVSRQDTTCVTRYAGILATSGDSHMSFSISPRNQIAYIGDGNNPLIVEFQECPALESNPSNGTASGNATLTGRLYAPHYGKCFAVTNQTNPEPPYYTTLRTCSTAYSQRWRVQSNGNLFFTGVTDEDGTIEQGGCTQLGYKAGSDGTPVITHTNEQITLECDNKAPFYFATTAA
ncbi:hypothetical protein EXIGLDRAFT_765242 [Exidia glandulosa HHB12029]|uniref:Ricin B lectin domain-containing protein n=1 Tax=Exidia glandulosa HHB12029 TaxID=1314781 RepID=A0A166AZR8_EXIGL|nr:hypothetical protein EXIGLDRAFT_765242 [Exidia glandulosa HHB12029]